MHEKKIVRLLHLLDLQLEIIIQKTIFKRENGFKIYIYINISIKLHSVACYSPMDVNRIAN